MENFKLIAGFLMLQATQLSPEWLAMLPFVTFPLAIIGFYALIVSIFKLVKMLGAAEICRLPLRETSEIEINETGELNVCLEVPAFTLAATGGLSFGLINKANGRTVELHRTPASLMSRNSGVTMTFAIRAFQLTEAGKYELKVSGINAQKDYSRYVLIIARPTALKSILYLFAILFSGLLFVGGLVLSIIGIEAGK